MDKIHSMRDPEVIKLVKEAPEGVNAYYHALGTLGGTAVREKYSSKEATLKELESRQGH